MGKFVSAEYVTLGHPDRMCDTLAAILINKIQQKDLFNSHAAIEVFAADDTIIFGGEVVTSLKITNKLLKEIVKEGFELCGYSPDMRKNFSKEEVYLAKDVKILNKIHAQSPDIQKSTTGVDSRFNDQGIFYGAYDGSTPTGEGQVKYLAHAFGDYVFVNRDKTITGPDIKVLMKAELEDDDRTIKEISNFEVQIPVAKGHNAVTEAGIADMWCKFIETDTFASTIIDKICNVVIFNSETYTHHGFHADTSMTGRKITVNCNSAGRASCQNQIGGGSMIKPWHASDMLLPLTLNLIAKSIVDAGYTEYITLSANCGFAASRPEFYILDADKKFMSKKNEQLRQDLQDFFSLLPKSPMIPTTFKWKPAALASLLRVFETGNILEAQLNNFSSTSLPWCKKAQARKVMDSFEKWQKFKNENPNQYDVDTLMEQIQNARNPNKDNSENVETPEGTEEK